MKKSELLLISTEFPPGPGGIGVHAYSITKAIIKNGYDVTVICSGDYVNKDVVDNFDKVQNFKLIRFKREVKFEYINRIILVNNFLKKTNVRNIILSGKFSLWLGIFLKIKFRRINTIAFLHGSEINLSNYIFRFLTHWAISSADVLFAVSEFTKNLVPKYIRRNKTIHILENGLDIEMVENCHSSNISLRGYPALLTVGNVTPRKGQHRVIRALPQIIDIYPDAHYHVVGLPTYKNEFLEIANKLGVTKYITFWGRATNFDELSAFYKSADVFCILSENQINGDVEGFGIVVLEANYFKLPVIGARGCGVEAAVKDGYNGYLVNGDDQTEIALKIHKLLENEKLLAENSKKWAEKHNWDDMITILIGYIK